MPDPVNLHDPLCAYSGKVRSALNGGWPQCCCPQVKAARAEAREALAVEFDQLATEAEFPRITIAAIGEAYRHAAQIARGQS